MAWCTRRQHQKLLVPVPFNITATTSVCPPGTGGANCNSSIALGDPALLATTSLAPFGDTYYRFEANYPTVPFWITVGAEGAPTSTFDVYVALGYLPTPSSYDLKNCNQPYCDGNIIINLNKTVYSGNQTFFVLVRSRNFTLTLGVWFNSICAPGCSINGKCTESGSLTGLCSCVTQDWKGFDCNTSNDNGLPAQYIVLIIIASLVVASAIIGFIAWAYMQKKRSGYVKVKD